MIRGMSMQIQGGNTAQLNVSAKFKNEHSSSPVVKSGPPNYKPKKSPRDQCVFLSYYKCRFRNRPIFGVKANAGDHKLPDHRDEDGIPEDGIPEDGIPEDANPEEDENIDVEGVPALQAHMDPVDILLEYILKYAPEAECAIACYGDIQDLFFNDDEWPEDLREYLYAHLPTIDIDESKTGMLSMEQAIRRQHLREEAAIAPIREAQQAAIRERQAVYWEPQADDTDARDDPPPPEDRTLDRPLPETKEMPGQPGNLLAATIVLAKDAPGRTRTVDWPRHVLYNGGVVSSLTVSKDGTHIAAGFDDSFVRVWDLQTSVVFQLQGHSDNVWATMFSPSENNKLVSGSADKTAIIWDVSTCDIARTLSAPDITGSVYTVAYAPDGKTIATGSDNGFVYLWDADTGERKHHLKVHASVGLVLAFSPMGNRLVCVVTKGWIWDPVSGQQLGMIEGHVDGIVSCMAFSPDGSRILTGADDQTARVWSSENGEELVTLREHTAAVWAVAWSPDSQYVATGGLDETIVVCNSYSGEIIHLLRDRPSPVTTLLWTEDLLIAGAADGTVRLWNDKTGAFVAELQGHIDRVNTTVLAKGGVNVVSSAEDGTIRKWDMRDILRF
ncbi:hypothetical protein EUX98_g9637 [Antrodiella citrinella]|uniref:Uncharacterized protein n=1 Tax=Antrodiella citrinella TaxID=2447956 RepID=A0A4S4LPJ0_9APHY|nr:hypothetical protein EUX98_g9637 [Antrodiella citrinella]